MSATLLQINNNWRNVNVFTERNVNGSESPSTSTGAHTAALHFCRRFFYGRAQWVAAKPAMPCSMVFQPIAARSPSLKARGLGLVQPTGAPRMAITATNPSNSNQIAPKFCAHPTELFTVGFIIDRLMRHFDFVPRGQSAQSIKSIACDIADEIAAPSTTAQGVLS